MADTLALTITSKSSWTFVSELDHTSLRDATAVTGLTEFTDGTGINECNQLFHDRRILAAGASEDINLLAVSVSMFGGTISFAFDSVKSLQVKNLNETVGDTLLMGGQGSNAFSGPFNNDDDAVLQIPATAHLILCNPTAAGWDVAAGAYALRFTNTGPNAITYDLIVAGVLLES